MDSYERRFIVLDAEDGRPSLHSLASLAKAFQHEYYYGDKDLFGSFYLATREGNLRQVDVHHWEADVHHWGSGHCFHYTFTVEDRETREVYAEYAYILNPDA